MDAADADELSETFRNDGMQMVLDELLGLGLGLGFGLGFGLLGDALCIVIGGQSAADGFFSTRTRTPIGCVNWASGHNQGWRRICCRDGRSFGSYSSRLRIKC